MAPAHRQVVIPLKPDAFVTAACTYCHQETAWDDFFFRKRKPRKTVVHACPYFRSGLCQACHITATQFRQAQAVIRDSDDIEMEQALNMLDAAAVRRNARILDQGASPDVSSSSDSD